MQVNDDVGDRLKLLAAEASDQARPIEQVIEMTSREPSSDIPEHLRHMAVGLPDPRTLDVILATNMISVGVDIDRLGLMAVMGQPQATSEYIQATSRVGRQFPGLVVTMFNAGRSRDRSHYEAFLSYHSAIYRQVESSSVTPFSSRARDRGLHAVLVALARARHPALLKNDGARLAPQMVPELEQIRHEIVERVRRVAPGEENAASDELEEIINNWVRRAKESRNLVYSDPRDPARSLLIAAEDDFNGRASNALEPEGRGQILEPVPGEVNQCRRRSREVSDGTS